MHDSSGTGGPKNAELQERELRQLRELRTKYTVIEMHVTHLPQ
jgi:hypothetical protein